LERLSLAVRFANWWGHWVSRPGSRWATVVIWLGLVAVMTATLPSAAQMEAPNPPSLPATASAVVAGNLQQRVFGGAHTTPGLLVFYRRGGLSPQDVSAVAGFLHQLAAHPLPRQLQATDLRTSSSATLSPTIRHHGTTLVVPLFFRSTAESTELASILTNLSTRLHRTFGYNPVTTALHSSRLTARLTGPIGIAIDADGLFQGADLTLLIATTMLVLVLLVLIYRSPILPLVPLIAVGAAYALASAVLGALAKHHALVLDAETISIMTVLMFGAGTDYTLLVVARYREQLTRHPGHLTALGAAVAQAAGPVAMSAVTVMVALLALLFSQYGPDHRFAIPFVTAIAMTALAALTLVPGILALLGRRAFYPFVPKVTTASLDDAQPTRAARLVTRRPGWAAIAVVVVLAGMAAFAPSIRTTYNLLTALPASSQARQGYQLVAQADGAGSTAPATVLVTKAAAAANLAAGLATVPGVARVTGPTRGHDGLTPVAAYQVTLTQDPLSNRAIQTLTPLAAHAKALVRQHGGGQVLIAGETAQNANASALVDHDTAVVIPLVLGSIFLLLFLYLGSLIAALYLIATVVLSYVSALGLGYLVLHNLLHVGAWSGGVALYAFVFLVALGEDYNIFMVSAVWEAAKTRPVRDAVAEGVSRTSAVILAAGVILAGTFAVLTALPLSILLQFGTVTALGVLLDTLLVRSVLVPSITVLLGDRVFWPRRRPTPASTAPDVS